MDAPLEKTEELTSASTDSKERYLGSVRFFKHMILSVNALLILLPIVFLIIALYKNSSLQAAYACLKTEYEDYVRQTAEQQEEQFAVLQGEEQMEVSLVVDEDEVELFPEKVSLYIPFYVDLNAWNYILVNEMHPLSQDFKLKLVDTRNGKQVDGRIKYSLERMMDAAERNGMDLMICSAYRDYEKQQELIDESIEQYMKKDLSYESAFFQAKRQLERVGCSEHHIGLAVDIVGKDYQSLDAGQANTKEAKWLAEHAHEYGFILRYPKDKEEITGLEFESWHYRYVGIDAAGFMKEHNLCLEEFLELAQKQQDMGYKQEVPADSAYKAAGQETNGH